MADPIKVQGLKELRNSLKALDSDLPKALRLAFNDSADIVVSDAKPRVARQTGRAKGTVRARSTQKSARVAGGGRRAPYYPWLDFGGRVGRNRSVNRPFLKDGRYIYNAYFKARDSGEFQDSLSKGLIKVAKGAGIEVT